jgi:hypothetical protein
MRLAAYCTAFPRGRTAEETIAAMADRDPIMGGLIVKTQSGGAAPNPLVRALALYLRMFYEVWLP